MLLFGHTGLTLGAAVVLRSALYTRLLRLGEPNDPPERSARDQPGFDPPKQAYAAPAAWVAPFGRQVDMRLLFIGSLLPDIIDKPIGEILFTETFPDGRIFCHSMSFLALITLEGLRRYRKRRGIGMLVLSFGVFTHLLLDGMWMVPRVWCWPLFGLSFGEPTQGSVSSWLWEVVNELLSDPVVALAEVIGALVVGSFAWQLARTKSLWAFLRHGQIVDGGR